jgi:acyl-CoA synthetase (NDP forming)/RimJ/RimL family protein N-acetyltransferase
VGADDEPALEAFFAGLDPDALHFRFFGIVRPRVAARRAAAVDGQDHVGLVAIGHQGGGVVGHAEYVRDGPRRAEVAFATADDLRGQGLATTMLAHLAATARANGIDTFVAHVLPENRRMLRVLTESGFPAHVAREEDEIAVELATELSASVVERFERRERQATAAGVARILRPACVAVVGASDRPGSVGGEILDGIRGAGYGGRVYAVNRRREEVRGVRAWPSLGDLPEAVDLAVVAVPAPEVLAVARDGARRGVRALAVAASGFAEAGPAGAARQVELLEVCREAGMRLVGPSCLGLRNADPAVRLDATFGTPSPPPGPVGVLSQSGGLGIALMDEARATGLGVSSFVSVGNKADISGNDLLQFWESDPATRVALLYLESFGNPRKFGRVARRVARAKPIVAVKSGRSRAGARTRGATQTGALVGDSDETLDALFRQAGVLRARSLAEMLGLARVLAAQPLPRGRRVAVLSNVGGPAILCADACVAGGLDVVELPAELRRRLPAGAHTRNPVDLGADVPAERFAEALVDVAASGAVDAVIAIHLRAMLGADPATAPALLAAGPRVPADVAVACVLMTRADRAAPRGPQVAGVPVFAQPEQAAEALARVAGYAEWRRRPVGEVPDFPDVRAEEAATVIAAAREAGREWLCPAEVGAVLRAHGLPLVQTRAAATPEEAGRAASALGGTVVLKGIVPSLRHKRDAGAVRLGLRGAAEVAVAAVRMRDAVAAAGHACEGFLVQREVTGGVELLLGVAADPLLGPVVACGAGEVAAELQHDVALRLTPLTDRDARDMLRELRSFPLLEGFRGAPRADLAALEEILLRVGQLVEVHPEVQELDLDPLAVIERGACVVDARVRVGTPAPAAPWPAVHAGPPV